MWSKSSFLQDRYQDLCITIKFINHLSNSSLVKTLNYMHVFSCSLLLTSNKIVCFDLTSKLFSHLYLCICLRVSDYFVLHTFRESRSQNRIWRLKKSFSRSVLYLFSLSIYVTMRLDFATCASEFLNDSVDVFNNYVYQESVQEILVNVAKLMFMTVQECKQWCETDVDYYFWKDASNTITSWLLLICELLLQVSYESNKNWVIFLVLNRWIENFIVSLSYLFWNIKIIDKCALMIDMITRYEEYFNEIFEFALMKDSLFIFCVMSQCLWQKRTRQIFDYN